MAAYTDSHSYDCGVSNHSKQGSTISQRSSFDDSMNMNDMMIGLDNIR